MYGQTDKPMFVIYRFFKDYAPEREERNHTNPITGEQVTLRVKVPGKLREVHKVEYGPLGSDKTKVVMPVEHLRPKLEYGIEPQEGSSQYQAVMRWSVIEPQYERWLKGLEITPEGTPLAAWSGVSPEQAELLRQRGIHTVQQLAALSDSHFERYGIGGLRNLRDNAKRFTESFDSQAFEHLITERDIVIAGMKDTIDSQTETMKQMQQMMAQMQESMAQMQQAGAAQDTAKVPRVVVEDDDAFSGEPNPDLIAVERPRRQPRNRN